MAEHGFPDSRLTVLKQAEDHIAPNGEHIAKWTCQCSCGSEPFDVMGRSLRDGNTLSCGCLKRERLLKANKKYNKYDLSGNYGIGWASNTNEEFYFDLEDYDLISQYTWHVRRKTDNHRKKSLITKKNGKMINFHGLLGFKNYDHINRNELDNRKENLRPATIYQNAQNCSISSNNKSGFTGVEWSNKRQRWIAKIHIDRKMKYLGSFVNKEDAVKARLQAEVIYYKEFAPQRHLFKDWGVIPLNEDIKEDSEHS